jgi:pimeloyl-ACP methyl ester carboxylesterase
VIAFDRLGHGWPVILVDGALCYRRMGETGQLAELLAHHFTVYTYDRRGRGDSGDTAPYAVEREVEDIAALLSEAGGEAFIWGISSGAVLAMEATNCLSGIKKLALYEAPFIVDNSRRTTEDDWSRIGEAVVLERQSDAIKLFLKSVARKRIRSLFCRDAPRYRSAYLTTAANAIELTEVDSENCIDLYGFFRGMFQVDGTRPGNAPWLGHTARMDS